jgi:hypothetical protein
MEELDIEGALKRLGPYGLRPIERVLAGHTGTVQLLLSLLFNEPVDVVLIGQTELDGVIHHEIHREVSLRLRKRDPQWGSELGDEVCRAETVIDTQRNAPEVLEHVREGKLGIGQIAVLLHVPVTRTINTIEVTPGAIRRQYTMENLGQWHRGACGRPAAPALHYVITEVFPRELFRKIEW